MSEQVWWYATRAAGLMTWATATASVVIGLLLSTRALRSRTGPWFLDLHRFLGGITVVFLAAHLATLWADSFVEFGVREILVPGESAWKPEAIAWGIVAAYLLVAIEVSSLLRSRISANVWRVIHFSSFAAMIAGSYHAITAGSDIDNPITWVIAGIGCLLVFGLVAIRLDGHDPDEQNSSRLSDNREILEEMRQRLAELPIVDEPPRPQLSATPTATLPRRAPTPTSLPGIEDGAARNDHESVAFVDDPFAAVPLDGDEPDLGAWPGPSSADPFRTSSLEPLRHGPPPAEPTADADPDGPTRFHPRPFTDRRSLPNDGADLFENLTGDPPADVFGAAFEPVLPTPSAIRAPEPPASAVDGPPPLPAAVDPATGEPDEAAYRAWLRDWLVYAERYGDEAPEDPTRG